MTFSTYYDSNDTGLGGVNNTAGQTVAFLDKVLVNGYNSKTLTSLTQVGTLVTATLVSHGFRDLQFVTISGATPSGYNGTWQIVAGSSTSSTFQFNTVTSGMIPATGTLGCIVAPLGWSIAFTGTNLRSYRAPTGNRFYLYIDDTGTTTARATGYESMVEISTTYAINPFPLAAQQSGGIFISKSSSATAVRTILWGNGSVFYLFSDYTNNSSSGTLTCFGDFTTYKTGDAYNTILFGQTAAGTFEGAMYYQGNIGSTGNYGTMGAHWIVRSLSQMPGSVLTGKFMDCRFGTSSSTTATPVFGGANNTFGYPALIDGNLWQSTLTLYETAPTTPRGVLVGITAPLHNRPLTNYTIFTGAGAGAGKTYMQINLGTTGSVLAEISNTF